MITSEETHEANNAIIMTQRKKGFAAILGLLIGIHNSPNNGPNEMIPSGKLIYCVLPIHIACSIIKIGPLVA
jgi:hypothetical protein